MRPYAPKMASPASTMARDILRGDKNMSDEEAAKAVASYIRSWLPVDERDKAEKIGAKAVKDAREYLKKPKKTSEIARRRALAELKKELKDVETHPKHGLPEPIVLHDRRDRRSGPPERDAA